MDIGTILALKEEVDDLSKRQENIYRKIKEYCQSLEPNDISSLSYADAKEVYTALKGYLPESVKKAYETKRLEEYPELKKAINYPELNEIDFLPPDKIKKIDSLLAKYERGQIVVRYNKKTNSYMAFFRPLKINEDVQEKLVSFLCDKGILTHGYAFYCRCGRCHKIVTESEYEHLKAICKEGIDCFEDIFVVPCYLQPEEGDYEVFDKESFENANCLDIFLKGKDPDKNHLTW